MIDIEDILREALKESQQKKLIRLIADKIGLAKFKNSNFDYSNDKDIIELWKALDEVIFGNKLKSIQIGIATRTEAIQATAKFCHKDISQVKPPKMFYASYLPRYEFSTTNGIVNATLVDELFLIVEQDELVNYPQMTSIMSHEMIHQYDAEYGEDHILAAAWYMTKLEYDPHDTPTFRRFMNMLNNEGIEIN